MRLVSREFCVTIDTYQASITRHLIDKKPLREFAMLYRSLAIPIPYSLGHLFDLSHRFHVVNHLAELLARLIVTTLDQTCLTDLAKHPELQAETTMMALKMRPYLLMLSHFLEMYRAELAEVVKTCDISVKTKRDAALDHAEAHVIQRYNGHVVHSLCSLAHFLIMVIARKLRPASYAGSLERRLRGWSTEPATAAECMRILVMGGLESVHMVISIPKFSNRVCALKKHLSRLSQKFPDQEINPRFYIVSHNDRNLDSIPIFSSIMPPLEEDIANKVCQVLPTREDFLSITRLATLFEPGIVLVDELQDPWDFAKSVRYDVMDYEFGFQAGAPVPKPSTIYQGLSELID